LPSETGPELVVRPLTVADSGFYRVVVSNELGEVTSRTAVLRVRPFTGMQVPAGDRFRLTTPVWRLVTGPTMPQQEDLSASWSLRRDDAGVHGRVRVIDDVLRNGDSRPHHNDGIELYLDLDNHKSVYYEADDVQIRIIRDGLVYADRGTLPAGFFATQYETETGYTVEFTIPAGALPGPFLGIDVQVIDNDGDRREHKIGWASDEDTAYYSPATFGTVAIGQ
jgi:endo-1,4-beta-xylanase